MAYRSIFQDAIDSIGGFLEDEDIRRGPIPRNPDGFVPAARSDTSGAERRGVQEDGLRVGWKVIDHPDANGGGRTNYGDPNQSLVVTGYLPDDYAPRDLMREALSDLAYYTVLGLPAGRAIRAARRGSELRFGRNFRVAPFGNRTGHQYGRYPHYHRKGLGDGQGIGRHRPWEPKSPDTSFWDRF
jgi:hypothetical protein